MPSNPAEISSSSGLEAVERRQDAPLEGAAETPAVPAPLASGTFTMLPDAVLLSRRCRDKAAIDASES